MGTSCRIMQLVPCTSYMIIDREEGRVSCEIHLSIDRSIKNQACRNVPLDRLSFYPSRFIIFKRGNLEFESITQDPNVPVLSFWLIDILYGIFMYSFYDNRYTNTFSIRVYSKPYYYTPKIIQNLHSINSRMLKMALRQFF